VVMIPRGENGLFGLGAVEMVGDVFRANRLYPWCAMGLGP
jgi:hypothetical protein